MDRILVQISCFRGISFLRTPPRETPLQLHAERLRIGGPADTFATKSANLRPEHLQQSACAEAGPTRSPHRREPASGVPRSLSLAPLCASSCPTLKRSLMNSIGFCRPPPERPHSILPRERPIPGQEDGGRWVAVSRAP